MATVYRVRKGARAGKLTYQSSTVFSADRVLGFIFTYRTLIGVSSHVKDSSM